MLESIHDMTETKARNLAKHTLNCNKKIIAHVVSINGINTYVRRLCDE